MYLPFSNAQFKKFHYARHLFIRFLFQVKHLEIELNDANYEETPLLVVDCVLQLCDQHDVQYDALLYAQHGAQFYALLDDALLLVFNEYGE